MHPPRETAGRLASGAAVAAGLASAALAAVLLGPEAALRFGVITVIILAARRAQVPAPFTTAFAVLLLLATWASVLHWYRGVPHFDLLVHLLSPGSAAAVGCFVLAARGWLPRAADGSRSRGAAPLLWTVLLGTTIAVVWELYEWVVQQVAPQGMIVGYTDTVLDLAAGMLSSAVAGAFVVRWTRRQSGASRRRSAGAAR